MPVNARYRPDSRFASMGGEFADPVAAADFPRTILRFRNDRAAATVGLETLSDAEWTGHFGRFEPLPGAQGQPLAMRYHGHQFRSYNPELGDGRGFLFAQLREDATDRLLDLATKGSGQTPWSRHGDGRLTLKGGMREILAASLLEAQGVPTSRAFSLIETGEALTRGDEPSPTRSAVLTRLSHSHIRFGTFQRLAYFDRADLISQMVDHVVETYFPHLADAPDRPAAMFEEVVVRTARLVSRWMAAGFVHGVLNTDNMVVTGESFDYGPWRFLPRNDPNFTAAYFDHSGLYSFGRQPEAGFWNLQQLAACLVLVSPDQAGLIAALNRFSDAYKDGLRAAMIARLAVKSRGPEVDVELVNAAFKALAEGTRLAGGEALRWEPFFFDWFGGEASQARALEGPRGALYQDPAFAEFRSRLAGFEPDRPERLEHPVFGRSEPEELLIEEVEALWAPIDQSDDWAPLNAKLARLENARAAYDLDVQTGRLTQV
ncbi:YdiU family protein [Caulobacter flavus]|uniref:Protein nucleotidyltransferase YdiU n=1 Tax=Caulobacter flavus TaxID=1679497 RepID=A0A2N5CZ33_9CAUL|nr:YdiU family protein [Caulobacter flavus]AYV45240.1 YdiU family protein [Caulobacter flavus]PLR19079.1 YdiU family protein [Caulobacter flavus]